MPRPDRCGRAIVQRVTEPLDCRTCGACCAAPDGETTFVAVDRVDLARLGPREAKRLVVLDPTIPSGLAMAVTTPSGERRPRCACLEGALGARVTCTVYEVRPEACRDVQAGDAWCLESRRVVLGL